MGRIFSFIIVVCFFLATTGPAEIFADNFNLTDQERIFSQEYIHKEKQQRLIDEACLKEANPDIDQKQLGHLMKSLQGEGGDLSPEDRKMIQRKNELCSGSLEGKAYGVSEKMLKTVRAMWTMVMGFGQGGGLTRASPVGGAGEHEEEYSDDRDEKADYCQYIPHCNGGSGPIPTTNNTVTHFRTCWPKQTKSSI